MARYRPASCASETEALAASSLARAVCGDEANLHNIKLGGGLKSVAIIMLSISFLFAAICHDARRARQAIVLISDKRSKSLTMSMAAASSTLRHSATEKPTCIRLKVALKVVLCLASAVTGVSAARYMTKESVGAIIT